MKAFEYTFDFRGRLTVRADSDEEAEMRAESELDGLNADIELVDKTANDPTGGDGRDD